MRTALLVLLSVSVFAQSAERAQVDKIFSGFNTHTPGCAVGVAKDGRTVFEAGYGMADLERRVPVSSDTIFESGSVAKQFTAAAIVLLAQKGLLSLDDPLRKHLPELRDYGSPVTIRQVLSHVSGLREWRALAAWSAIPEGTRVFSNDDLLELAALQRGLNFDPGSHYSYSNTGFNLLPIVVDRALKPKTFQQWTKETIFDPLGMRDTRWRDDFRTVVPRRALAYGKSNGEWVQQTPIENIFGAGGLLTTVADLQKWNENFTATTVGGREFVEEMQVPATLTNGRTIAYAKGLMIAAPDGVREVAHSGATGGYRTWLGRYPEKGVSVAVLCNSAEANATELGRDTARIWTKAPRLLQAAGAFHADPSTLEALAGMYRRLRDNEVVRAVFENGKLRFEGIGDLQPVTPGTFRTGSGAQVVFENGPAPKFRWIDPNGETSYERVERVSPKAADLAAYVGEYRSLETKAPLTVAMDGSRLTLKIGSGRAAELRPTFRDAFSGGPGGSAVLFLRDSSGRLTGFSAGDARTWDLRFERIR
ncbi:MAG: serine hydrolase domain-containing protein [Bryobacteraceae bacterium]|nr:serine hydrolase domain-containing protein [Bryobacteraceae bacterium]